MRVQTQNNKNQESNIFFKKPNYKVLEGSFSLFKKIFLVKVSSEEMCF